MPSRTAPINTYRMYIPPESAVRESEANYIKNDRRKAVSERRQENSDRRKARAERRRPDEKLFEPVLQELRNSFSFRYENEQAARPEDADSSTVPRSASDTVN